MAGALLDERLALLVERWRTSRYPMPYPGPFRKLTRGEIEAAAAALLVLQRGLTGARRLAGRAYMDDRELLAAYLLYYWPVSYMQVSISLVERPFSPRRVLDLGSGPGPASAALIDACSSASDASSIEELVLVDDSSRALDLAESIIAGGSRRPGRVEKAVLDLESDAELPEGPFDLIVAAHCLNELWLLEADAPKRREGLIRRAAERLAPGGRILLVEPALLATCRDLIALRDALASSSWRVLGPCPGSFACPAFAAGPNRSCHAQAPWEAPEIVASLAKAAGLDRTSVKFAYFLLSPEPAPEEEPSQARRVVSDPMLNKAGRLRYVLCGEGRLETISARGDDAGAAAKGFMGLRRGDTLVARGLESREGGGYGLLPDSELDLRTRAPEASS
jgi:SAM-dependent methyltransferase